MNKQNSKNMIIAANHKFFSDRVNDSINKRTNENFSHYFSHLAFIKSFYKVIEIPKKKEHK
jgi:hypothetical protein